VNRCTFLILNYFDGYAGVYGTEKAIDKLEQYYDTYSGWIKGHFDHGVIPFYAH
jgi:hypothetical protein